MSPASTPSGSPGILTARGGATRTARSSPAPSAFRHWSAPARRCSAWSLARHCCWMASTAGCRWRRAPNSCSRPPPGATPASSARPAPTRSGWSLRGPAMATRWKSAPTLATPPAPRARWSWAPRALAAAHRVRLREQRPRAGPGDPGSGIPSGARRPRRTSAGGADPGCRRGQAAAVLADSPRRESYLGLRGIRLTLQRPQILETQLRALFRAAGSGRCG